MRALLATIFLGQLGVAALAQGPEPAPESYPLIMEELPPHLESRRAENRSAILFNEIAQGQDSYVTLTQFDSKETIRVCFFEGSTSLRVKIARIATRWTEIADTSLKIDFGDPASPRLCGQGYNHIRIGFAYKGYWSLVGRESVEFAAQSEQSMNFARFNTVPPPDDKFERIVLHEFGHALGFYHEHQNEIAKCDQEYNWKVVENYLRGDPNYWSDEQIARNMKVKPGQGISGPFDVKSIMIYAFPKDFYVNGDKSPCFATETSQLSDGDKLAAQKLFPKDFAAAEKTRRAALEQYVTTLNSLPGVPDDRKALALNRVSKIAGAAGTPGFATTTASNNVRVFQTWKPTNAPVWFGQPYAYNPPDGPGKYVWGYSETPDKGWVPN